MLAEARVARAPSATVVRRVRERAHAPVEREVERVGADRGGCRQRSEADAVLVGLDAQVDDLRRGRASDGAVGGLDLVPAARVPSRERLAQRRSSSSSETRRESTCPPWKPIAARRRRRTQRALAAGCDELGQDAAGRGGVQERDARAADADARRLVDQPHARRRAARASAASMSVDLVGDVVQARARAGRGSARRACRRASGASSSTWLSPTSSSTASTPCSAIVSRCTSGMPYVVARAARSPRRGRRRRRRCGRCGRTRRASASARGGGAGRADRQPRPRAAASIPSRSSRAMRDRGAEVAVFGCEPRGSRARRRGGARPARRRRRRRDDRRRVAELAGRLGVPLGVIPGRDRERLRARRPACRSTRRGRASSPPRGAELRRCELGRLGDGRPFVNVASAGLASVAARRAAAAQAAARARSPTRVGARRAPPPTAAPLRVHACASDGAHGVRRRGVAGDRRRHRRVRRRLGDRRRRPARRRARRRGRPRRLAARARPPRLGPASRGTIAEQRGVRAPPRRSGRGRRCRRAPSSTPTARSATAGWSG